MNEPLPCSHAETCSVCPFKALIEDACERDISKRTSRNVLPRKEYIKESVFCRSGKMKKLSESGYTHEEIGIIFNMTRQNAENMLNIYNLAPEIKRAIGEKKISPTAALRLKHLSNGEQVVVLLALNQLKRKTTVSNVEIAAKKIKGI